MAELVSGHNAHHCMQRRLMFSTFHQNEVAFLIIKEFLAIEYLQILFSETPDPVTS